MPYGMRKWLGTAGAAVASLAVAACLFLMYFSAFPGGEKEYYLFSASSQAERKKTLSVGDLFAVRGESAVYVADSGRDSASIAKEIRERYAAEILFTETVGDTVSYYCHSSGLGEGIILNGCLINLHIAVRTDSVAVGTPIIFGGY